MRRANALILTIAIALVFNAGLTAGPSPHAGSAVTLFSAINLTRDTTHTGEEVSHRDASISSPFLKLPIANCATKD